MSPNHPNKDMCRCFAHAKRPPLSEGWSVIRYRFLPSYAHIPQVCPHPFRAWTIPVDCPLFILGSGRPYDREIEMNIENDIRNRKSTPAATTRSAFLSYSFYMISPFAVTRNMKQSQSVTNFFQIRLFLFCSATVAHLQFSGR